MSIYGFYLKMQRAGLIPDMDAISATEIGFIDGVTAGTVTASKALVVDANKDLATIRNLTVSGNLVHGASTLSAAETGVLDGVTPGTAIASKAVVLDASKDVTGINSLTATTIVATAWSATTLNAGASGTAGTLNVFPTTAAKGKLAVTVTDQTGDTTVALTIGAMGQASTITLADPGNATSFLVQSTLALTLAEVDVLDGATAGTQVASKAVIADANINIGVVKCTELHIGATGAETQVTATAAKINYVDITTPGTQEASKAIVTDANINQGIVKATQLHIGASGSEVQVNATPAEIDAACDRSARVVSVTATDAITEAEHEGRECYITGSGALTTLTLPEATGSGGRYRFIMGEVNTSNTVFVVADTTNANFIGSVNNLDLDASAQAAFGCPANCDTITLNGTTQGGQKGDWIEFVDVGTDVWMVTGQLQCPTGSNPATCFSAAV